MLETLCRPGAYGLRPSQRPVSMSLMARSIRYPKISHSTGLMKIPDPDANLGDPEDPENVRGEIVGFLWLDRHVESNGLPFILQAYATWISRFLFEPLRVIQIARHEVFRLYATGEESRRMMHLIAGSVYEITRSTDYNPIKSPSFATLQIMLRNRFIGARTRVETSHKWDRKYALGVMLSISEFTFALSKVMSLSTALGFMQLVAPVFRLACPHPLDELINLPTLFTTKIVPLQYYSTLDVLLGVLTSRPMFFRYDVKFTPEAPELIFQLEDGPGIRWCDGIPDQIVLIFAQMNSLYEDFGPRVRKDVADKLEAEIKRMRPTVGSSTEPLISIGRTVVQECWFLAALIYLYMGLCGANSTDIRVVAVRAKFMRILVSIRPKRHPDAFLVFPMVIIGVATDDLNERNLIRQRILGVAECSRPGTMENDFLMILNKIWSKRLPVVWSYLREGCWEVSGCSTQCDSFYM
ncbi:unnamed protein product [Rhizoctonia solani]|uniref:Uncharacterized protein n=1 Tax=Rhizoctonia solani TaxID=456999 RepID=A0A8H3GRA1_9AGAM|nr:unnamed protein product [Rhizoctonia solani]